MTPDHQYRIYRMSAILLRLNGDVALARSLEDKSQWLHPITEESIALCDDAASLSIPLLILESFHNAD